MNNKNIEDEINEINEEEQETKQYACRYFYDGDWWDVLIYAYDWEDAEDRCKKIGNIQLEGEVVMSIPNFPGSGVVARLVCWFRNLFC